MSMQSLLGAVLGALAMHQVFFIRGEWHLQAPQVVASHVLALLLLVAWQYVNSRLLLLHAAAYLSALLLSIAAYRLLFHRLRRFPGPRLAALSKLWHCWKCRDSRGHDLLESLHRQYGTLVRTGPNEITIFHPAAFELMDGAKSQNTRSDWYDLLYPRISSIFTRDKTVHDARRKMWDQALSVSSLKIYYTRMAAQVETLLGVIGTLESQPVTVNDLMYWFAFDSMGDFGFGHDFGMMRQRAYVDGASYMRSALSLLGPFSPAIWVPRLAFAFIPRLWKVRHWFKMLEFADSCTRARIKTGSKHLDISSTFIADYQRRGSDQVAERLLSGDIATMLVAGSDTTAPSLILLLYCLARYPQHAAIVQHELEHVEWHDVKALSDLVHLTATIHESMRLLPAIPTFSSRVVGPQGLAVDEVFIPPGTKICAPRWSLGRLEAAYEQPHAFIPERWYSRPELVKDKRAFSPFGIGRMSCVGRNIAMAQLRLVAAAILTKYHISFAPGQGNCEAVERDLKDQLTANPGKLKLVFERR